MSSPCSERPVRTATSPPGEAQGPRLQVPQGIDRVPSLFQGLEYTGGVGQEAAAYLRQPDAAAGPLEQPLAQVSLQGLDAGRHRRLGEGERIGGAGEAPLPSYLNKRFE